MNAHKETLNRHKLNLLNEAAKTVVGTEKTVNIKLFRDNINSYNNWQKLRYHGLIARTSKRGEWVITSNGWKFLSGDISLPKYVIISENRIVEYSDQRVEVTDILRHEEIVQQVFEYFRTPKPQALEFAWDEIA